MRNHTRLMKVSTLALGVVSALACSQAFASGFQIREDSVQAMARSHAGSASAAGDAAVVANNPAAMSLFDSTTLQSDLSVIDVSFHFAGGGRDALGRPVTGGNGGNGGDTAGVPALHFILPVGDGWTFGASLTAPFGLKTNYDNNWVGRYQALKSDVKTMDLTFAGSYKFNDMFSAGASLIYQHIDAELTNAVDFGAILAARGLFPAFQPQSADGAVRLKGNDDAWGWDVGLLFRPTQDTNIGLNYRSKISHTVGGNATFQVPSNVRFVFGLNPATASLFTNTPFTADVDTPAVTTLSITQKFSDTFALSADIERTNWDSLQSLNVHFANPAQPPSSEQFHWSNSTEYAIGFDWKLAPEWILRGGYAHDETPTNDTFRDPRLPDNNRNLYSVGLGFNPSKNASWNFGYSRINIKSPNINDLSATGSTLVGKFNGDANLFGVSGTFTF
jgi:long-chain fatty acid transport protein